MKTALFVAMLCSALSLYSQDALPQHALVEASYSVKLNARKDRPAPPGVEGLANIQDKIEVILLCNAIRAYSSIPYPFDSRDATESLARIIMRAESAFYTNMATSSHIMEVLRNEDRVLVELNPHINWSITDTVSQINGIRCIYAVGTIPASTEGLSDEKVSAWFAPEYPLPFGPQGLFGLPGLIVQAERSGKTYALKRLSNISDKQIKIPVPGKGKYIKSAEFFKR